MVNEELALVKILRIQDGKLSSLLEWPNDAYAVCSYIYRQEYMNSCTPESVYGVSNDLDKVNILNNQFYGNFNHTPANIHHRILLQTDLIHQTIPKEMCCVQRNKHSL